MVGYEEEFAARQGANVEASFGDLDAEVSDPFGVRGIHATAPGTSRRPSLGATGWSSVVAVVSATVRAPPF
jgi:hypothetical protein